MEFFCYFHMDIAQIARLSRRGTVGHFFGPYLFLNDGCHDIKTSKELRILSLCPCVIVRETEREGERRRETGRQAERKKGQGDRGTGRQKGKNKERRTI